MKIRIAVCDDDEQIGKELRKMTGEILQSYGKEYSISVFRTGEELCRAQKDEPFGLIILDVGLPGISGADAGNTIREKLGDERVQIAYISAKSEYAMELFESRPINFLIKPVTGEALRKVIDKFLLICAILTTKPLHSA